MFFKKYNKIDQIYNKIVKQSRSEDFYLNLGVPDTFDGRFDMLLLTSIILIHRLSSIRTNGKEVAQNLFDTMFLDLDYSLREIGAGDVGVSSNIKKMASAYLGRQKVYSDSFKKNDINKLMEDLKNNVYRNIDANKKIVKKLALYCFYTLEKLDSYSDKQILLGNFDFPKIKI